MRDNNQTPLSYEDWVKDPLEQIIEDTIELIQEEQLRKDMKQWDQALEEE